MVACDDEDPHDPVYTEEEIEATTAGRLTITGMEAYNGKKIDGIADSMRDGVGYPESFYENEGFQFLIACQTAYNTNYYEDGKLTNTGTGGEEPVYGTISSGQVTLKVFMLKDGYQSYTGNHQNVYFNVYIYDDTGEQVTEHTFNVPLVNFTNGVGSGVLHWN